MEDLLPARSGVRAQAVDRDGKLVEDFRFAKEERWLHVLNAPSPGATASLAIGEYVAGMVEPG
jgi:L-2-hydroxyglutarate oxidase LhgO